MTHKVFVIEGEFADDFDEIHESDLEIGGGCLSEFHDKLHELCHSILESV